MNEDYTWVYETPQGTADQGSATSSTQSFPTQADAEAWLSQEWAVLAEQGVTAVTLQRGPEVVYGPMSLSPAE